ncbi:carbon-nitrogen hydrolase family protein [Gellertiella hungarica]|uniref:Putative amidohydrolase n=1 Tax=Gellertiella hungarica TaxID=1572859 RepID=A0A7W6J2M5_9HYPH|nr:carbon-nitrogen hydrolase family protein [Gellertiella hungarica]MBB4062972.1 putative amidohydrolase [Gellertiella hungarica]
MLIAALQMEPVPADTGANLAKIERAARSAAAMGVTLLVAPELAVSGYSLGARFATIAEPAEGPSIARIRAMAAEQGMAICVGFPERADGVVYNSAVLATPSGDLHIYRKCHLYGPKERAAFAVSTAPPAVFELGGLKVGMLICYDVEFPEMVRGLALQGAQLVLVPTALPAGPSARQVSRLIVPSRAMENQLFIAYADLCGVENGAAYEGRSVIAAPDGEYLARAGRDETLLFARINPAAYAVTEAETPYLADRMPEVYRKLLP